MFEESLDNLHSHSSQGNQTQKVKLSQQALKKECFFFAQNRFLIDKLIHSNHANIKKILQQISLLAKAKLNTPQKREELDNCLNRLNTYIAVAILNDVEEHEVQFQFLTRFPKLLFMLNLNKLKIIQHLKVKAGSCQITSLPCEIAYLSQLVSLELSGCSLSNVTPAIGKLQLLQRLILDDNALQTLPKEIGELSHLKEISLCGNPTLGKLPEEIMNCKELEILKLQANQIGSSL